jgi:hypothetical protein
LKTQTNNPQINYSNEDLVLYYQNKIIKYWVELNHPEVVQKCKELAVDHVREIENDG